MAADSQIARLRSGFVLAQNPNNLLFREPGSLYLSVICPSS
jgi:hypothetical protein